MKPTYLALPMLAAASVAALSGVTHAQQVVAPTPVVTETTTSEATGPSMAMVGSGIAIFALSYTPVVVVGATSGLDADRTLFVPIAGPWIDFAQRPGCSPASQCNTENTNKVLLATDGVFQAIGALTVVGGFLATERETKTVRAASRTPELHLAPAPLGYGAYGVAAAGEW
jgi:hypothetical protein